jgi:hypothetical protein
MGWASFWAIVSQTHLATLFSPDGTEGFGCSEVLAELGISSRGQNQDQDQDEAKDRANDETHLRDLSICSCCNNKHLCHESS